MSAPTRDAGPAPLTMRSGRVGDRTVLVVASLGAFLAFLDATIVNVAFPSIRASFPETSISGLSWVLNSYNIVFAAFLVPAGRLADLIGRRRAFGWGVVVFTVASVVCALSPTVEFLVAARAVQALGAAMLVPASLALVVEAFAPEHRTHAVGLWGASAAVAAGLGPPIGGALIEVGTWRWAFLVNLPIGLGALWAARRQLVESRAPGRRRLPDLRGAALFATSLALLTLGIVQGNDWGWTSPAVIGSFVGAAAVFGGFVWSSTHHPSPLLDPALLRIRPFAVSNAVTVMGGMGFYAYLLTNILWLQYVWGYSVLTAGLALVPAALVAAVVAAVLGPRAAASGYRRFIVPGAIIWCLAFVWYYEVVGTSPAFLSQWLPGQILSGIGVGATLPLLGSAALAAVPGGRYATASAVVSSARQIGGVLGIALLVVIIGTPSPASAAADLRPGWLFAACCFAVCAVGALFIGRIRPSEQEQTDDPVGTAVKFPATGAPAQAPRPDTVVAVPLFGLLPERARAALTAEAVDVHVPAGAWLLRQGDPADAVYLVRTGRLDVVVDDVVVRELGPGAVVGELALLAGGTRSASIRARRDATVSRVSHEAFERATGSDPQALAAMATVLARQLQDARPAAAPRPVPPCVVAVLGLHRGAPVAAVAAGLVTSLGQAVSVVSLTAPDAEQLERAERDHDRVVIAAQIDDDAWLAAARQADRVVLVAASSCAPEMAPDLDRTGADLVLVGPRPARDAVAAWCDLLRPWQVSFCTDGDLDAGLRPLAARIAGTAVGVVMAGGGARAFAHIGVLQEFAAAGIAIDRVAGTSLGSIVAALHAAGHSPDDIHEVCYAEFVRRSPFSDYTVPTASLAKGRRARAAINRQFGDALIEELPHQLRVMSTDLLAREAFGLRRGRVADAVAASLALPVLFPPRPHGDRLLVDGGVLDNLPVSLLTERDEGPLLAVNIPMGGGGEGAPRDPSRARRVRVPALGETLLRTMTIGSGGATDAALAAGAVVITPSPMGVGLLEFHQLDAMVQAGRVAARDLLEQTGGSFPGTAAR